MPQDETLDQLMLKYGSDKASAPSQDWQWAQDYCRRVYQPLLDPIRHNPVSVLEVGWGEWDPVRKDHANPDVGGRSARAWHDYFDHPDSTVTVIEFESKTFDDEACFPKVRLFQGCDATQQGVTDAVAAKRGPFDLVVDDASHVSSQTIRTFKLLWPHVKPGGLYVVEDLHSSYHDYYFGRAEADRNPDTRAATAMQWLKRLADEAFYSGQRLKGPAVNGDPRSWDCYPRQYWMGYQVESVSFHAPQIAVVRKRA